VVSLSQRKEARNRGGRKSIHTRKGKRGKSDGKGKAPRTFSAQAMGKG